MAEMKTSPLHIVMTPVRNEAWVLRAFLENTSQWADYIIIADQMSTDGSREIAKEYEKVILIDNTNPEFNEAERQSMLIAKAREVAAGRDTLLWGLDADEILAANTFETEDWKHILNSQKGDVFWFKWAEICPDKKHYWLSPTTYYPWLFHDDGKEPHGNYVRNMHSMRIPYPIEEKQMYYVNDFRVLHLAYLNRFRVQSKRRFYTLVDWELNHRSPISLSRNYAQIKNEEIICSLPEDFIRFSFDIWSLVNCTDPECWMDLYVKNHLSRYPLGQTRKLPIWDDTFCNSVSLKDPRKALDRWIHSYLAKTQKRKKHVLVRLMDCVLKRIY